MQPHLQYALFNQPLLRIRDLYLYPSRIPDPGSRISDPGSKNSNIFCNQKFHKIVNYFIFEMMKKKIWANFQRIIELFTQKLSLSFQKYGFGIRDPGNTFSRSRIQGSKITGSRIRIRNTATNRKNIWKVFEIFLRLVSVIPFFVYISYLLYVRILSSEVENFSQCFNPDQHGSTWLAILDADYRVQ